ncbi:MAG TPA: alpha/beta hydrolase [Clostridiales bacterium]|nr:alpha/beta hydrolase [Clostridiales bacterium]
MVEVDNAIGFLWFHGGGYLNGMPEAESKYFEKIILETNCIIFAPDYTKSLDKPYPQALHEAYDVLKYIKDNASKYNININQLFIGGLSAGGGLTAALSLYARDKGEVAIAFQMPLYPMLDDRMITESSKDNDGPIWNSKANRFAWKMLLGDLEEAPIYAAPARAKDYSNLPPTLTFVGGIDLFRDETTNYINNLKQAGIYTNYKIFEGCFHGFEALAPWKKISKEAYQFMIDGVLYARDNFFKEQPK